MDALTLRCQGDRDLAQKLLDDPHVKKVVEWLEKEEDKSPRGTRRQLLATSLRLTRSMMPDVHKMVEECRERLGVTIPLELYVYPDARFNAACVKPEEGRLFIMVSSGLLESFPGGELRFVMGHELGHHLYGHHDIPIGVILQGKQRPSPGLALRLFAWSRYAEISADRAGAHCVEDPDDVARSLFRLASGLVRPLSDVRIDEFVAQVDEIQTESADPSERAPRSDWFSTHPFSPLRLRALKLFFDSELAPGGTTSVATLEARVQELLALMDPSYLEEKSDAAEAARRLLFSAAIVVIHEQGTVSEEEIRAFESFFGETSFSESLDIEAIRASLEDRVEQVLERVSHPRRIQVIRDLCVIARADGEVAEPQRQLLVRLASRLDVPAEIVHETLCGACDLD